MLMIFYRLSSKNMNIHVWQLNSGRVERTGCNNAGRISLTIVWALSIYIIEPPHGKTNNLHRRKQRSSGTVMAG